MIKTDASIQGLRAVLIQQQEGQERVVAYASRSLSPSEAKYPAHKLEFRALHWAITVKFRDYLYGHTVTAITDNNPLTYVLKSAKLDAHSHRWVSDLSLFNLDIQYRPGRSNGNADALSRISRQEVERILRVNAAPLDTAQEHPVKDQVEVHVQCAATPQQDVTPEASSSTSSVLDQFPTEASSNRLEDTTSIHGDIDLLAAQQRDPTLSRLIHLKTTRRNKLSQRHARREPRDVQRLLHSWDNLAMRAGLLVYSEGNEGPLPVLPLTLQGPILARLHDEMGHLGFSKTLQLVRERYYWPNLYSATKAYVAKCRRCALRKTPDNRRLSGLQNICTTRPLELVCIDFLTLERSAGGYEHVLVVTDHYTRYAQAYATRDEKATTVARVLWEKYMSHYGIPERLHSDQGKCFTSAVVRELCHLLGITKSNTTPYHPQGNGMTERFNRTLLSMLGTLTRSQKVNWAMRLPSMTHAYNSSRHESTGYSPFHLMFMRKPRLPADLLFQPTDIPEVDEVLPQSSYVRQLRSQMRSAYREVNRAAEAARQKQTTAYNKKVRECSIQPGMKVLVANKTPRGKCKLRDKWEDKAYVVLRKLPTTPVYVVRKIGTTQTRTLHRNMLIECPFEVQGDDDSTSSSDQLAPQPQDHTGEISPQSHSTASERGTQSSELVDTATGDSSSEAEAEALTSQPCTSDALSWPSWSSDEEEADNPYSSEGNHTVRRHWTRRMTRPPQRYGDWV